MVPVREGAEARAVPPVGPLRSFADNAPGRRGED
jgi:hypothetical protein